jgi:hypothetical protein
LERAGSLLGRLGSPKRVLRALACTGCALRCSVRPRDSIDPKLLGSSRNGTQGRFEYMLLLIEELLNVVGAELNSIGLLLACVAPSLAVLDLRLAAFSA